MNAGQTVEARDLEAVGDHERQYAQYEASASNHDRPMYSLRKVRLRRAFLTLCAVDLVS